MSGGIYFYFWPTMSKKGILLVNLGTPDSPSNADVRKYLREFLTDPLVIDINPIARHLLVKGIIAPTRGPKSAKLYREIWDEKTGSPLLHFSRLQQQLLQERLGSGYQVELGMRYQSPSIASALQKLKEALIYDIVVIPLFPQYASASTGSVYNKVMELLARWPTKPSVRFINSFHDNARMIQTFAEKAARYGPENFDQVLFSFHGLPQRQLVKADHTQHTCLCSSECCRTLNDNNRNCYAAQCHDTARLIAARLNLAPEKYTVCFQSRLGSAPWVQPYTVDVVRQMAAAGKKRLLVLCPAFVADCLETIYEVPVEYGNEFKALGGEQVQLVESLNADPGFIEALAEMAKCA